MLSWSRYPTLKGTDAPVPGSRYKDASGAYLVTPRYAVGRGGRRLRRIVWHLYEHGVTIGRPFHSARLAKAFAEALAGLGDDRRARAALVRDGAGWCYDKENEWRREREARCREAA